MQILGLQMLVSSVRRSTAKDYYTTFKLDVAEKIELPRTSIE